LLTQVHDVDCTETATLLEAALAEVDEIKRLDPPYNVQLRAGERMAWFASRDLREVRAVAGPQHPIGPLPSEHSLVPLAALVALDAGDFAIRQRTGALSVPTAFLPDDELFREGWHLFANAHLARAESTAARRLAAASHAIWLERGRSEPEAPSDESPPAIWDLARVQRRLERNLVQTGLLVRRARILCLLAEATVAFREAGSDRARVLEIAGARIVGCRDADGAEPGSRARVGAGLAIRQRQNAFDAAAYDRMRVLLTELHRVRAAGGGVTLRVGTHRFAAERLDGLMRDV
jgi:DNA polymerase-3 subunit epsilon